MIILPNKERRLVDPSWRGTVIVDAEGTNEGLADLHARCRGVWRVLRERRCV